MRVNPRASRLVWMVTVALLGAAGSFRAAAQGMPISPSGLAPAPAKGFFQSPQALDPTAPTVTLTAPVSELRFTAPAAIRLSATVQASTQATAAQIRAVDFYANQTLVGTATQAPYTVGWSDVGAGTYTVVAVARNAAGTPYSGAPATIQVSDLGSAPLVQKSSLVYRGSFRLPSGTIGGSNFSYGGSTLAYNPAHDSLFLVGYEPSSQVAEIAIPEVRTSSIVSELAVAGVLQVLTDATEGKLKNIDGDTSNGVSVGGLLPYKDRLYLAAYSSYDANLSRQQTLSHFVSGLEFSVRGDVTGPFAVGTLKAGFVSGYFGLIPKAWQGLLGGPVLNGNCCLNIISRTSWGPSAFAIDPESVGAQTPAPATPLLYYTTSQPLGPYNGASASFNGTTEVKGVVFPEGSRSVLFFGKQGLGTFCYGPAATCGDPASPYSGPHAYPYANYVWAYDAQDLADVKAGKKLPWTVSPYGLWQLDYPFPAGLARTLGAAYDPGTGRLFLSQSLADNDVRPLIHVFSIQLK